MSQPVVLTVSDLHLSHRPPLARMAEPDWYDVMKRHLLEIESVAEKHKIPVVYAGDIFHKYNPPPRLIAFALKYLPSGWAIPGQHDLPHHVYENMDRTAYGCLVEAGVIKNIHPDRYAYLEVPNKDVLSPDSLVRLVGFPWGTEFIPLDREDRDGYTSIAIVHKYIWTKGKGYKGASEDALIGKYRKTCKTYNAVVFGDNHKGFLVGKHVVNNGTMMRRNSDEIGYDPCYSLIHDNGEIARAEFKCCDEDVFTDVNEGVALVERALDMTEFIGELGQLGTDALDFFEALKRFCDAEGISDEVRSRVMDAAGR